MTVPKDKIPPHMLQIAKVLTDSDPGIAIAYNNSGLQAHHPNGDVAAAKLEIANAIVNAGMQSINGYAFFTGGAKEALTAQDAVNAIPWTFHIQGVPDIGVFYFVYPRGGNDVEFVPSRLIFNA